MTNPVQTESSTVRVVTLITAKVMFRAKRLLYPCPSFPSYNESAYTRQHHHLIVSCISTKNMCLFIIPIHRSSSSPSIHVSARQSWLTHMVYRSMQSEFIVSLCINTQQPVSCARPQHDRIPHGQKMGASWLWGNCTRAKFPLSLPFEKKNKLASHQRA